MLRRGRGRIDNFEPNEPLYRRCTKEHVIAIPGSGLGVRFPDFSVNRGGPNFGPASDVLLPSWPDHGVVEFSVSDIPSEITSDHSPPYNFKPVHEPLEENYAHSEVRTFKGGLYDKNLRVSSMIKKQFRQILGERARIAIDPKV
jgi:hypothetical protein